jgi:histidine triad (HIT) family protein
MQEETEMDCVFCKIISGEIPSQVVYEDDSIVAIHDIQPKAPVHFLAMPKKHISSSAEITEQNSAVIAHIFEVIAKLAKEQNLENGYRVVTNVGIDGAQSVKHLHFHVLAGRRMNAEMG